MKPEISIIPKEQGYYFAKERTSSHWQLLVLIIGVAPFMGFEKINTIIKESDDQILSDLNNIEWSEKIELNAYVSPIQLNSRQLKEVKELIYKGQKLMACKVTKECTGFGLRECKAYIDDLCRQIAQV